MQLFDTHAHLESDQIAPHLESVLELTSAGELCVAAIGTDVPTSYRCLGLAQKHENIWAAVGLHPNHCAAVDESHWTAILGIVDRKKVVAIGETGLDKYWDDCPFDVQMRWFEKHVDLSFEKQKPLVIHMRDCETEMVDALERLSRDGKIIGIMHSFCGSADSARRCLELGMYISFAGMVTYKNAQDIRDVAKTIPADRLLIETDSPYLSPVPVRKQRPNLPQHVRHTAQCVADCRGVDLEELVKTTNENARRVFGIGEGAIV